MEEPQRPAPKRQITLKLPNIPSASTSVNGGAATPSASVTTPGGAATTPQTPSAGPKKIKLVRKSLPSTPATEGAPVQMSKHMPPPPPPAGAPTHSSDAASSVGPLPNIGDALSVREIPPVEPKKARVKLPTGSTKSQPATTKAGRVMKPTAKKRAKDDADSDEDVPLAQTQKSTNGHQPKKIKLVKTPITPRVPTLKLKARGTGKIPYHPPGEGYDSEAEDREIDPVIESQFVFRMIPGEDCEYLRQMINERKIGCGADVHMRWLDEETRRCMIKIRGNIYAGALLDLPTITESMKTWDKKAMVKSADICQMLLVFAKVDSEEEAKTVDLPKPVEKGWRWPHGLTPPMHDCRNRRFRKRLSKLEIQDKEREVERLLAADKAAVSTTIEYLEETEDEGDDEADAEGEEDADGEVDYDDYFGGAEVDEQEDEHMEIDENELEAQMEAEFLNSMEEADATPAAVGDDAPTPATAQTTTPAADSGADGNGTIGAEEEDSGDDEDDDDEEDMDDGDVDVDGDEDDENHGKTATVRAEIANLKKQLAKVEQDFANSKMPILRKRLEQQIRNIKSELDLKKSSIGETDED